MYTHFASDVTRPSQWPWPPARLLQGAAPDQEVRAPFDGPMFSGQRLESFAKDASAQADNALSSIESLSVGQFCQAQQRLQEQNADGDYLETELANTQRLFAPSIVPPEGA
ncbi:MAG: hypothetical protein SFZ03_07145 [Candidatus Melainabacteria bacterium]|nr:hypothetical protein [Candidatus Melainabacteria bacterium]